MASGQIMFAFQCGFDTALASATAAVENIAGASTPAENYLVYAFDDTTVEYIDKDVILPPHYSGGGLTFKFVWASTATSGNHYWSAAIRRFADDADDMNTGSHTYDFNDTAALTPASASGELVYDTLTFTNGADMDSWAAGELARIRIRRPNGGTGDAYLKAVIVTET